MIPTQLCRCGSRTQFDYQNKALDVHIALVSELNASNYSALEPSSVTFFNFTFGIFRRNLMFVFTLTVMIVVACITCTYMYSAHT